MRKLICAVLSAVVFSFLLPVFGGIVLGGFAENNTTTMVEKLIGFIFALLNATFIWWMVYEVFIK